jgi:hypothetical protein
MGTVRVVRLAGRLQLSEIRRVRGTGVVELAVPRRVGELHGAGPAVPGPPARPRARLRGSRSFTAVEALFRHKALQGSSAHS